MVYINYYESIFSLDKTEMDEPFETRFQEVQYPQKSSNVGIGLG